MSTKRDFPVVHWCKAPVTSLQSLILFSGEAKYELDRMRVPFEGTLSLRTPDSKAKKAARGKIFISVWVETAREPSIPEPELSIRFNIV